MIERLKDIFENVNNWLKFAETKNATLVAGNGLLIFGILKILQNLTIKDYVLWYVYFCLVLFTISLILSLISFIPKVKIPYFLLNGNIETADNLLFYGDLLKYNEKSLLEKIKQISPKDDNDASIVLNTMYAEQIIINSKITRNKLSLFDIAIKFTLAGIVSPIFYFLFIHFFLEQEVNKLN